MGQAEKQTEVEWNVVEKGVGRGGGPGRARQERSPRPAINIS